MPGTDPGLAAFEDKLHAKRRTNAFVLMGGGAVLALVGVGVFALAFSAGERVRGGGMLVFVGVGAVVGGFRQLQAAERDKALIAEGEEPLGDEVDW